MNPSNPFNPAQHVTTLRQSHRAVTSLLPVLTATLTVAGAVIAALEARAPQAAPAGQGAQAAQGEQPAGAHGTAAGRAARSRVSARRYLATLVGRMLLVTLGIALVLALVYVASVSGQVGQAILLTALILLSLYLVEKVARR